jgi:hypothetical protein
VMCRHEIAPPHEPPIYAEKKEERISALLADREHAVVETSRVYKCLQPLTTLVPQVSQHT